MNILQLKNNLGRNGDITLYIVEWFDESLYDFNELCNMNQQEIDAYNNGSNKVSVVKSELDKNMLTLVIKYTSDDAYYDMNNTVLFYGDCASAKKAGYNLTGKVSSVSDSNVLSQKDWEGIADKKVIIVSESIDVVMPSKPLYVSEGVSVKGNKNARIASDGLQYIICD